MPVLPYAMLNAHQLFCGCVCDVQRIYLKCAKRERQSV